MSPHEPAVWDPIGLCASCTHHRPVESDRGGRFHLCRLSVTDEAYPRYPRLPVRECPGYVRQGSGLGDGT